MVPSTMKRFLEEAKRLIRMNSVSGNGNEEIANFAASLMQDRGLKTQLQHVMHSSEEISKRQFNVIGILGDPLSDRKIRKGLLLGSHLDTVSPGILANWTQSQGNPFLAVLRDGKIYGLGVADAKLDFLCKLYAIERFREKKLKMPIYLVGTCAEEIGMLGARYLIQSCVLNPQFILVGEPSDLSLVHAHSSLSVFRFFVGYPLMERDARGFNRKIDLYTFGESAHSAYPHLGSNAIFLMVHFLQSAIDEGFEVRFTKIEGGDAHSKVPDRANAQFYLTAHQVEDFKRFFREYISVRNKGEKGEVYRIEVGGIGDSGVRFLPEGIFSCLMDGIRFFQSLLPQPQDTEASSVVSTINFGELRQKNCILEMYFDLRLLPEVSPEGILKCIREGISALALKYPSLNLSVIRERMHLGLNMPLEDSWVGICQEAMRQIGIPSKLSKKLTSTETAFYFQAGYPALAFGPGRCQGNSHSPNEMVQMEHLEKSIAFYEKVIDKVCV